mgnify:CR=1 FL=1
MLLLAGSLNVGEPNAAMTTCAQLSRLKSVLPRAVSVGFPVRREIRPQAARAPIWPGRCGAFWTTYEGNGASIDVTVTLYQTSHADAAPPAEPAYDAVRLRPNAPRLRPSGRGAASGKRGAPRRAGM